MLKAKDKIIFLFITLFLLTPVFVDALAIRAEHIDIEVSPDYPQSNQFVTVSLTSYMTDLNSAEIMWFRNDILVRKGLGETSFSFETGGLGSFDLIIAQISSGFFNTIEKNTLVIPAEVDLVWEADSYTPPFYKGKAMRSYESGARVVAVSNFVNSDGVLIDSKDLTYNWELEGFVLGSRSGRGKDTLILTGDDLLLQDLVTVEVSSLDDRMKAGKAISLFDTDPEIIFYEEDPLLGTNYNNAIIGDLDLSKDEIVVSAVPYFFSISDVLGGVLKYDWSLNNERLEDFKDNIVTLRQGTDDGGTASLYLQVENIYKILQSGSGGFNINFTGSRRKLFE